MIVNYTSIASNQQQGRQN